MTLLRNLADCVLQEAPNRAAVVLERLGEEEAITLLKRAKLSSVASIVERLSPQFAAAVLGQLRPERVAKILESLQLDTAVRLLRRADVASHEAILEQLRPKRARGMRALLRFREGTAGALMDPDVLALPQDLTAREALQRVRAAAENARYNLYVVDQSQRLTGTLNLRELLIARGPRPLSDVMVRDPYRVRATDDRTTVLAHRGWKVAHALPVVDDEDGYLGAIRYRTLRELERELIATKSLDLDTSAAFAEVISAAAGGLLDAVGGVAAHRGERDGS